MTVRWPPAVRVMVVPFGVWIDWILPVAPNLAVVPLANVRVVVMRLVMPGLWMVVIEERAVVPGVCAEVVVVARFAGVCVAVLVEWVVPNVRPGAVFAGCPLLAGREPVAGWAAFASFGVVACLGAGLDSCLSARASGTSSNTRNKNQCSASRVLFKLIQVSLLSKQLC
jgi:hypothetical protein